MERILRVSEVARRLGRSERWLRESEVKGKIPEARRDLNNWRIYSEEDVLPIMALLIPENRTYTSG